MILSSVFGKRGSEHNNPESEQKISKKKQAEAYYHKFAKELSDLGYRYDKKTNRAVPKEDNFAGGQDYARAEVLRAKMEALREKVRPKNPAMRARAIH